VTRTGRRPLRTVQDGDDFDHLPRKRAFEAQHPEAFIGMIASGTWQARIRQKNGETVITRWYLRDLMDELEKRYPPAADQSVPLHDVAGDGV
jgi:hypothetical protein